MNIQRSHISVGFLSAFLSTTFALQWWQSHSYPLLITAGLVLTACCAMLGASVHPAKRRQYVLLAMISAGMLTSVIRVAQTTHITTPLSIESEVGSEKKAIRGTIVSAPDKRPLSVKYTIEVSSIQESNEWHPAEGRILVTDRSQRTSFRYGDTVAAYGMIEKPSVIHGFSYDQYLQLFSIYALMNAESLEAWQSDEQTRATSLLTRTAMRALIASREWCEERIAMIFPEPSSSLLTGLLTGSRRGMPERVTEDFQRTGLSHITAISGYNITIILTLFSSLLFWLPIKKRLLPLSVGIVCFTVFVGASSSVVRAAIMGILGLLALQAERQAENRLILLWTAFLMVLWHPNILWYDVGFHLSFFAVIGIMTFSHWLSRHLAWMPDTLAVRTSLVATLSAQLGTLPIMMLSFGQLSIIAPVANILVAPLIPIAMLSGALSMLVGSASVPLASLVGIPAHLCLSFILNAARVLAAIPFAALTW